MFTCAACQQVLHFENSVCMRCGHALAFLPEHGRLAAVEPVQDAPDLLVALDADLQPVRYRLCGNYIDHAACKWGVIEGDANRFCRACRLNDIIPNLADPAAKSAWARLTINIAEADSPFREKTRPTSMTCCTHARHCQSHSTR